MSRYIDADALIQLGLQDGAYEYVSVQEIADFPTADVVEVKHGEWLEDSEGEIYCSKCGKYTYDRHDEIKEFDGKTVIALCYPRFCGNCGADMRGGTE